MKPGPASSALTMEFGHEMEVERSQWLRRRFYWYAGLSFAMSVFGAISTFTNNQQPEGFHTLMLLISIAGILICLWAVSYVWFSRDPRLPILRIVYWMILMTGGLSVMSGPLLSYLTQVEIERRQAENPNLILREQRVGGAPIQFRLEDPEIVPDKGPPPPPDGGPPPPPLEGTEKGSNAKGDNSRPETVGPDIREGESDLGRDARREARIKHAMSTMVTGLFGVWSVFVSHFFACIFLPWTSRESLQPIWPLLGLNALVTIGVAAWSVLDGGWSSRLVWMSLALVGVSLLIPLPGLAICEWRHGRFRKRFTFDAMRGRYSALKAELTNARQIHESLFPEPIQTGHVRFDYVYEPMSQIGGDYLHTHSARNADGTSSLFNFVIVDVTGHGIPAALTVNRLHGELERIFAEQPTISPGEVLRLLNSYVHLTLASHSVYVTAICLRVDAERGVLDYASGGHPPAFLRSVDGRLDRLDSTALVLGAAAGNDFQAEPRSMPFGPGDALIAYTDGATEARDAHGRYFGIEGIQRVLANSSTGPARPGPREAGSPALWPATLLREIERHREGPTMDDVLVIEIRRAL